MRSVNRIRDKVELRRNKTDGEGGTGDGIWQQQGERCGQAPGQV